jgi:2-furoyl-CoA dehydrogenase large subunit
MSTPVCIANAVADALGVKDVKLPLTPARVKALMGESEKPPRVAGPPVAPVTAGPGAKALSGSGTQTVPASPDIIWRALLDPTVLARVIPGCHALDQTGPNEYRADVSLGVGIVKGRFTARVALTDLDPPRAATLSGGLDGSLGSTIGHGRMRLTPQGAATQIDYDYVVDISGKAAAVGGRMLDGATKVLISQFFQRFFAEIAPEAAPRPGKLRAWWQRLLKLLGLQS